MTSFIYFWSRMGRSLASWASHEISYTTQSGPGHSSLSLRPWPSGGGDLPDTPSSSPQLKRDVVTETKTVELVIVADNSEVSVLSPQPSAAHPAPTFPPYCVSREPLLAPRSESTLTSNSC